MKKFLILFFLALPLMSWGQKIDQVKEYLGQRFTGQAPTEGVKVVFHFSDVSLTRVGDGKTTFRTLLVTYPGFQDQGGGNLQFITVNGKRILNEAERKNSGNIGGIGEEVDTVKLLILEEEKKIKENKKKYEERRRDSTQLEKLKNENQFFTKLINKLPTAEDIKIKSDSYKDDYNKNLPEFEKRSSTVWMDIKFWFWEIFFMVILPFYCFMFLLHVTSAAEVMQTQFGDKVYDWFMVISRAAAGVMYILFILVAFMLFFDWYFFFWSLGGRWLLLIYVIPAIYGLYRFCDWSIRGAKVRFKGLPGGTVQVNTQKK